MAPTPWPLFPLFGDPEWSFDRGWLINYLIINANNLLCFGEARLARPLRTCNRTKGITPYFVSQSGNQG